MKKNLSKAMAAALTVGAVAPIATVVADAAVVQAKSEINVFTAEGYTVPKVVERTTIYNTNNTTSRKDDTLKSAYKDVVIGAEKLEDNEKDSAKDLFVIYEKKATIAAVNNAKADIETAKAEIAELKEDGYSITKEEKVANIDWAGKTVTTQATVKVTAKKSGETDVVYTFVGVQGIKEETTVTVDSLKKIFTGLNDRLSAPNQVVANATGEHATLSIDLDEEGTTTNYYDVNLVKYTLEKNLAKFDVVKDETGTNNKDLEVTLYQKGTKKKVLVLTFLNTADIDKDEIKNIPAKTDFTGHWAEDAIVEAMLKGHVNATGAFRPKDGVTRAEFVKMVNTMFGISFDDDAVKYLDEPFTDVKSADWFYNGIVALYNTKSNTSATKGTIVGGYADETFKPKAKITRQEAAKMIAAAYEVKGKGGLSVALTATDNKNGFTNNNVAFDNTDGVVDVTALVNGKEIHRDIKTKFKDDAQIGAWADEAVAALSAKEIIGGNPDGTFKAQAEISRVEALLMLQRASK